MFLFGFAKSDQANLSRDGENDLKAFGALLRALDAHGINTMMPGENWRRCHTMKKTKYRSEVAAAVHEGVSGMHRLGLVNKKTMRESDVRCLTPVEDLSGKDIQALREREGVSQSILARCLNVTTNYVSQLERGTKRPRGAILKLLWLIRNKGLEAVL